MPLVQTIHKIITRYPIGELARTFFSEPGLVFAYQNRSLTVPQLPARLHFSVDGIRQQTYGIYRRARTCFSRKAQCREIKNPILCEICTNYPRIGGLDPEQHPYETPFREWMDKQPG